MSSNPFLDQVRSSFQRSRSLNAGPSLQPNRVISEIQNRLERELATAKEQVTGPDPISTLEFEPSPVRVRHLANVGHK